MRHTFILPLASLALFACPKDTPPPAKAPKAAPAQAAASQPRTPASQPTGATSQPSQAYSEAQIEARVAAATARLNSSEAGRILLAATEAHGGLSNWFKGRALTFRYDYQPVKGPRRNSLQTVDLLSSRAYHTLDEPTKGKFAFDGRQAWVKLESQEKFAARFWALTPYYFVGMPFVLSDPGVKLELSADDPALAGLPEADVIRATFAPGTGDAPDDYYVVYVAKDDHRVLALRYVVSYAPFFEGKPVKSSPEKLLVYEAPQTFGPLKLATRQVFYGFADGRRGDKVTVADLSEVTYGAPFDEARLHKPEGAVFDTSL